MSIGEKRKSNNLKLVKFQAKSESEKFSHTGVCILLQNVYVKHSFLLGHEDTCIEEFLTTVKQFITECENIFSKKQGDLDLLIYPAARVIFMIPLLCVIFCLWKWQNNQLNNPRPVHCLEASVCRMSNQSESEMNLRHSSGCAVRVRNCGSPLAHSYVRGRK